MVQTLQANWLCTSSLIESCQHASCPLCCEISCDSFHSCKLCTFEDLRVQGVPKHPQLHSRGPKHVSCRSFWWLVKVTQPSKLTVYQQIVGGDCPLYKLQMFLKGAVLTGRLEIRLEENNTICMLCLFLLVWPGTEIRGKQQVPDG